MKMIPVKAQCLKRNPAIKKYMHNQYKYDIIY